MSRVPEVVIAGVSTRGLVESAVRAGWRATGVDAFGDLDQEAIARTVSVRRALGVEYGARVAAQVSRGSDAPAAAYVADFENHLEAVELLARARRLLGNPPAVLARVRDPFELSRWLRREGLPAARVRASAPRRAADIAWLRKPRRSGGGRGIVSWRPGMPVSRAAYLQERIRGRAGSIVFAADGSHAVPLGFSRQLIGDRSFGATGFRYAGNILTSAAIPQFPREAAVVAGAAALARAVTAEFGLVGVNGIDFVARGGLAFLVEVNPRYTASMELAERAYGISIFRTHAAACSGTLPAFDLEAARARGAAAGKAIVYARRALIAQDTTRWLRGATIRDIPHPGERIGAGHPICTVFARGKTAAMCHQALVNQARRVEAAFRPAPTGESDP